MNETIRALIAQHGRLPVEASALDDHQDLYAAGLTSFSAVQLMLAIEEAFDLEFPERLLNRRTFESISAIASAIAEMAPSKAVA